MQTTKKFAPFVFLIFTVYLTTVGLIFTMSHHTMLTLINILTLTTYLE